jgi:RimJ/RimL family protein N-acetyltransferase
MAASDTFDFQPKLIGDTLVLRPLLASDLDGLCMAAADPFIWEQHPSPQRYQREIFEKEFFSGALASGSAFVIEERNTGRIIGSSRYYDWQPDTQEIAVGFTFLIRDHWGGNTNSELKSLMLQHAFQWANRVWFHIGKNNWRSRKGTEKIGARFSHENKREIGGTVHEYAFYVIDKLGNESRG